MTNLLEAIKFEMTEAVNAQEGLKKDYSVKPYVITKDLTIPVMNDFGMVKQMRCSPELKNSIIIASSASVFEFYRQEARPASCDDFLPKAVQAKLLNGVLIESHM